MTTKTKKTTKIVADSQRIRYAFVPLLQQFRAHTKKNEARLWIPIETNLIFRYEFAACSLQTRYIFVAILLYCGANGIDEIPLDAKFMANILNADPRTVEKSFEELLSQKLLLEREKREKRKEQTDREKDGASARVSVSSENLSENQSENGKKEVAQNTVRDTNSTFTLDECRRYVQEETSDGATIANPNALAMKLFKTGQADAFIKARLYPEQAAVEQYGEPTIFTDATCSVCFGAKLAEIDGDRFGKCLHCRNEKGQATGKEPSEIS